MSCARGAGAYCVLERPSRIAAQTAEGTEKTPSPGPVPSTLCKGIENLLLLQLQNYPAALLNERTKCGHKLATDSNA